MASSFLLWLRRLLRLLLRLAANHAQFGNLLAFDKIDDIAGLNAMLFLDRADERHEAISFASRRIDDATACGQIIVGLFVSKFALAFLAAHPAGIAEKLTWTIV